jgi:dipeptidyl aminopeptidase/acylaminoacyl peptidase
LQALGKNAELLEFPDEGHLIGSPANRALFWDKVFSFVTANCGG